MAIRQDYVESIGIVWEWKQYGFPRGGKHVAGLFEGMEMANEYQLQLRRQRQV